MTLKSGKIGWAILLLLVISSLVIVYSWYLSRNIPEMRNESKGNVSFNESLIIESCKRLCIKARKENISLENGPCLSDLYREEWNFTGWVCDVAHYPRQEIDNLKENQCSNWWIEAKNFVEVTPECEPIKIFEYGKGEKKLIGK